MVPIYFAFTSCILTMLIVWKGAASLNLNKWDASQVCATIFGTAFGFMFLVIIFLPWLYRRLWMDDWNLKWRHIIQVPPHPEGVKDLCFNRMH
jgi:sodium-dependent phosphate transporter